MLAAFPTLANQNVGLWRALRGESTQENEKKAGGEAGFWILDFGFWILDFGFWILDFGFWILDFGFWRRQADSCLLPPAS
jgi:hypothetical protein